MDGPWDRASGRKGVRHVAAPATLPAAVRYRFCAAPVHVPPDFTPDMVTRSAKKPPVMLRRRAVNGYNGLGTHNRAPNVHTRSARTHRGSGAQSLYLSLSLPRLTTPLLPLQVHALGDGRLLFASAALGIVHDTASGAQHYYEGHDDDVTAVALHPAGELAATAQIASAWSGTRPWIAVWRVTDGTEVRRVGWVADPNATDARGSDPRANAAAPPRPREAAPGGLPARGEGGGVGGGAAGKLGAYGGDPIRPFYERSICARRPPLCAASLLRPAIHASRRCSEFSPDGSLLIAVGCDDQHTIGVWDWRRGELLVSRPGLTARPPGIHQLCAAPMWAPDGAARETARTEGAAHASPSYPSPPRSSRSRRHAALRQRRPRRRAQVLDAHEAAAAPGGGRLGTRIQARTVRPQKGRAAGEIVLRGRLRRCVVPGEVRRAARHRLPRRRLGARLPLRRPSRRRPRRCGSHSPAADRDGPCGSRVPRQAQPTLRVTSLMWMLTRERSPPSPSLALPSPPEAPTAS